MMTSEEKKEMRALLDSKVSKTEKKVRELKELIQPISPENSLGRISRMDAINNQSVMEANLRSNNAKLAKLKLALSKIDHPDFGVCSKCKGIIPKQRILLMPESSYCVKCAR